VFDVTDNVAEEATKIAQCKEFKAPGKARLFTN
jgi:hypothetical protein